MRKSLTNMTPAPLVALTGATPAMLHALRPAGEILARFGVAFSEVASTDRLADAYRAVIVASDDAALPAALAVRSAAPVIRVPCGSDCGAPAIDVLTWPAGAAPYATVAIGEAGARNAALLVISILALDDEPLRAQWEAFRAEQTAAVLSLPPFRA